MGEKRKFMEDEMSRFEAEISSSAAGNAAAPAANNMFVPHQLRPIIGANTYHTVQQKLHQQQPPQSSGANANGATMHHQQQQQQQHHMQAMQQQQQHAQLPAPSFISSFQPQPEKSYSSEPTPVVLSSAPKLYLSRPTISMPHVDQQQPATQSGQSAPSVGQFHEHRQSQSHSGSGSQQQIDIGTIQFDVTQKLKKLKAEKSGPNPIAEAAIQAARASSALQNFQLNEKRKKDKKTVRTAGGQVWEDHSLADWTDDDFRIFCGDLGNDVNDELLTRTFNKYASFIKAKVIRDKRTGKSKGFGFISFKDPMDFSKALKEMDGRYVGSRPIKLRKSSWKSRSFDVVKRKEKEKVQLLQMFNKS